jgi:hypothetical protein
VHASDLAAELEPRGIEVLKYRELAFRAVFEVLQPLGGTERVLKGWIFHKAGYAMPENLTNPSQQSAE